jgi:hypothetical protein
LEKGCQRRQKGLNDASGVVWALLVGKFFLFLPDFLTNDFNAMEKAGEAVNDNNGPQMRHFGRYVIFFLFVFLYIYTN